MAKITVSDRANRVLQYANYLAKKTGNNSVMNRIECMQIHFGGYVEPGYKDPESGVIVTGNWNLIIRWNKETSAVDTISNLPKLVCKALERIGCAVEWEDEWCVCYECGKIVRVQPDCYTWTMSAAVVNEC